MLHSPDLGVANGDAGIKFKISVTIWKNKQTKKQTNKQQTKSLVG